MFVQDTEGRKQARNGDATMNEDRIEKLIRETIFPNERHKELLRVIINREELEMSNKTDRLKEIFSDRELVRELADIETSEAAREWFAAHGAELTAEEVEGLGYAFRTVKPADKANMELLDLDELEDVAGGIAVIAYDASPSILSGICNKEVLGAIGQAKYDLINILGKKEEHPLSDGDDNLAIQWGNKGPKFM